MPTAACSNSICYEAGEVSVIVDESPRDLHDWVAFAALITYGELLSKAARFVGNFAPSIR